MAGHDFKIPGLIRAGFQYQDLVAIETLIDFYRDRQRYAWVQVDASDPDFKAVEDVVACTPTGLFDLTQVKFTADPDAKANSLNWDWLLAKKPAASSLLEKWSETTLRHQAAKTLGRASLKTDRIPDAGFAACLDGRKVDYGRVPPATRTAIEAQVGSATNAATFFSLFEFVHSMPRLDDLEDQLWSRIASDTDRGGWALFREQVQRWAMRKDQPHPDGKIRHIHLRQAFSVERPKPIPQGFLVPPTYSVPDEAFDTDFLATVTSQDGVRVLWGPPGRGKSTYLSHCVARIDRKTAVCIRHHYFLSLDDRTEGRFQFQAISRSLQHQLGENISELDRNTAELSQRLAEGAARLAAQGRRLIIVIDGLDHVWREHRDREDMEELFAALLPLPANTTLIVGTQKIATQELPPRLVRDVPVETWTELPLMSEPAVLRWLKLQREAGRLNLELRPPQRPSKVLREVSRAFHDISKGLPLHLIYSFEGLVRTGEPVTADDVRALPACPSGDIREYYRSFWTRAGPKARIILHVLAGLEFGPPPSALRDCFGASNESLIALAEIDHLLDLRETGVQPFHGSLFAFLRYVEDHATTFAQHAGEVLAWLSSRAPPYWQWAWLWITQRQLGDSTGLLAGCSRDWAVDALAKGYPIDQLITVLRHAEWAAFESFDLPRLLALRSVKTRALNGPEFQTENWSLIPEVALSLSQDPAPAALMRSDLGNAPADLIPFLVRSSDPTIRDRVIASAIDELNRRILELRNDEIATSDRQRDVATSIVEVVASQGPQRAARVVDFAGRAAASDALLTAYASASILARRAENCLALGELVSANAVDREVLAALCLEGLAPSAKPNLKAKGHPALCCLERLKGGTPPRLRIKRDVSRLFGVDTHGEARFYEGTKEVLYDAFFASLSTALGGRSPRGWSQIPQSAQGTWLAGAVGALEELAGFVAENWNKTQRWPTIGTVYTAFDLPRPKARGYDAHRRFIAVRLALRDIVVDLAVLGVGLDPAGRITSADIEQAFSSDYWLDELWLDTFSTRRLPLHTPEAAAAFTKRVGAYLDTTITEFNARTTACAQLALFAADHGLVASAEAELHRSIRCLLGYGWRKDLYAMEVVDSLNLLAEHGVDDASQTLLSLAGAMEAITTYTDGDETDHARSEFYEAIAKLFPGRAAACYAQLIRDEEWRYAEDLAKAFVQTPDDTPTRQALLETFIAPEEAAAVADLADQPRAQAARVATERRTGRQPVDTQSPKTEALANGPPETAEEPAEGPEPPQPGDFPPGKFSDYVVAARQVRDYDDRRSRVKLWLEHWDAQGRGSDALADLEAAAAVRRSMLDIDDTLDVAFGVALRTEGRTKALPWLIRAHVTRYGWQRWFTSSEEAHARMRVFAQTYPGQWKDFVRGTASGNPWLSTEKASVAIGLSRLVTFLVEVGELGVAKCYALEMARVFLEELDAQPIPTPAWAS